MNYFYGTLFFELLLYIFCIYKIIIGFKLFFKERKKDYLILIILIPLVVLFFYDITLPQIKDIKYALSKNCLVSKGIVEKTYLIGRFNSFILDGEAYQYNPWSFKPIEKNKYKIYYLPNSKFVVRYENE